MESTTCNEHEGGHPHHHIEEACGHESMRHEDHFDFEHEGHWHARHDGHWDEHPGPDGANPAT